MRVGKFDSHLRYKPWQRKAANFQQRFVISDKDIERADDKEKERTSVYARDEIGKALLWQDFDENEVVDRKILYEVTGRRLFDDEFLEQDSSSEESDGGPSSPLSSQMIAHSQGTLTPQG